LEIMELPRSACTVRVAGAIFRCATVWAMRDVAISPDPRWPHRPAHRVAAEDVEDGVEVVVGPSGRALELADIPAPDLVGARGRELGPLIAGHRSWSRRSRTSP